MRFHVHSWPRALRHAAVAAAALLLPAAGAAAEEPQEPAPIRALLVTGGGWHDFETQKRILSEGLGERTRIEWTIDHSAGSETDVKIERHETTEWADQFDVVLYSMCFSHVTDAPWIERIAHAHRDHGVAAVVLHCAIHSYRRSETDAWRKLLGVSSYSHEGHRPFTVQNLEPEHPIMRPFPEQWRTPRGELYEIEKVWPTATPLAKAWGEDTGQYHVTVWTNEYGEARVFGTTIGHHNETMEHPVYLDLVTRGLLWTLGKLEEDGTPAAGYGPAERD